MERNVLLTTFKKYRLLILLLLSVFLLSACGGDFTPISKTSTGFFSQNIVYPMSILIEKVAAIFGGSYGIAIIIITLGIRLLLMPFIIKQSKNSKESQEIMAIIKPEMDHIQAKYAGKKSPEDQLNMQNEMSALYKKHDYNPLKMVSGCLPMLIQMPILIGFYYAIRRTPEIAAQSFLWFSLGGVDIVLVMLAVLIYYFQSKVNLIGIPAEQKKQMKIMGFISPMMIGVISLNVPAALPLYWAVGGLFMIGQTLIIKNYSK